jgi:ATP-dependent Lon protease
MKIEASEQVLPLLSLQDIVVFPHTIIPLFVENEKTVKVLNAAYEAGDDVLVCCRMQQSGAEPEQAGRVTVGVSASILQLLRLPNGSIKVFLEGKTRQNIKEVHFHDDQLYAATEPFIDFIADEREAEALRRLVLEAFKEYVELCSIDISHEVLEKMDSHEDPGMVSDIVVSTPR